MNNMNIDDNTVNKLKDMMNKGELNEVISQIPPEMIQNFSSMFSNNQNQNANNVTNDNNNNSSNNNEPNTNNSTNNNMNNANVRKSFKWV